LKEEKKTQGNLNFPGKCDALMFDVAKGKENQLPLAASILLSDRFLPWQCQLLMSLTNCKTH